MIGGWAEMLRMMRNIEKEKGEGNRDAQGDHEDGHGQDDDVEGGEDAQTDETISTMGIKVHGLGTFTNIFTSKINNISTEWPGRRKGVRDKILDIETEEVIREDGLGGLKEKGKRRLVVNKNQEMNTYQSPMKRKRFSTVKYSDIATAEGCRGAYGSSTTSSTGSSPSWPPSVPPAPWLPSPAPGVCERWGEASKLGEPPRCPPASGSSGPPPPPCVTTGATQLSQSRLAGLREIWERGPPGHQCSQR